MGILKWLGFDGGCEQEPVELNVGVGGRTAARLGVRGQHYYEEVIEEDLLGGLFAGA
jgi:hypothetical protein